MCFWRFISLLSGVVAVGWLVSSAFAPTVTEEEANSVLLVACGGSILFGAFSLHASNLARKIKRQSIKDQREQATFNEMRVLRYQVANQNTKPTIINKDQIQIKLAGRFWREGKKDAALEILRSMPSNDRVKEILEKINASL